MTAVSSQVLDLVFGPGDGLTPEARASSSQRGFVRGLDLLTLDHSPKATGRRLTAREALETYGFDKLLEAAVDGSAILCKSVDAAGRVLMGRREQLALSIKSVAAKTNLTPEIIAALEASRRRPIQEYERVARVLGLDERMVSFQREPQGNQGVAIRLRSLHDERPALNNAVVIALAEAAWVGATQTRLEASLPRLADPPPRFEPDRDYGSPWTPAYEVGYRLARAVRDRLGLGDGPIGSMRDLVERGLQIPVISAQLGERIAGATIDIGEQRAIVINCWGRNELPFVARSTLAHELGHLLFDPQQRLHSLRVDEYDELERRFDQITDPVEQRANAFAVEFLAPQQMLLKAYSEPGDPVAAMIERFGISFTTCRYHLWNALQRSRLLESIKSTQSRSAYDAMVRAWIAPERYTTIYHPLHSLVDHPARAGRFSAIVLRSAEAGVVSWDTASELLLCRSEELKQAASAIRELYPDLF